jgi:PAS domain S-box-containing protein
MEIKQFALEIEAARDRAARLWHRAQSTVSEPPQLMTEVTEELRNALEELQVAQEELRMQNDQLIVARVEAEHQIQHYRGIFQLAPESYVITDAEGTILEVNHAAAQLLQVPAKYLIGKPLTVFIACEDKPVFYAELNRLLRDGQPQEWFLSLHPRRHGETVPHAVLVSVLPVRDPDKKVTTVRWLLRDTGEQRRSQELERQRHAANEEITQLKEAGRRKDEFLATLSHELRNKLTPILTAMQVLHERPADLSLVEWAREMIERQARQMARLVDDLLDVSRIACGKLQLCVEWVDLATIVARTIESTCSLIEGRGHQLTVVGLDRPLWLRADSMRLEQVLTNLLHNAAKYTEVGGRIWVDVEREGGQAVIRVRDTGIGMTAEFQERLFDLYMQSDHSRARSQGGLGIGLALVRRLVQLHGGTVEAHSAGPDQGSEFTVRLPGAVEAPDKAPESSPAKPEGHPARILVVDDNLDAAQSLAILLRSWGHGVTVASDGPSALAAAAAHPPDIALLDIGLPGMDGYQIAEQLRKMQGLEKLVLIAITGYGQEQDRRLSQQAGFNHHLVKPVDLEALQSLLAEASVKSP